MSLRRDIHTAFDDVAPALGGMPERVVQTVLSDTQRRNKGMTFRARVPLPLVAALVAAGLIGAVMGGGQLVHGWIATVGPSPAGGVHLTPLQQLEARPLQLVIYKSVGDCHEGPNNSEGSYGGGPIYADGGSAATTRWGEYFYNSVYTDMAISGPVLIRARDVLTGQMIAFAGPLAAGPGLGTDLVDGKQYTRHTELVIDESDTMASPLPGWSSYANNRHRFVWDFLAGAPSGWSGSTGWQIDGPGFTEIFYAC